MKRGDFLKSLGLLIASPKVIAEIDFKAPVAVGKTIVGDFTKSEIYLTDEPKRYFMGTLLKQDGLSRMENFETIIFRPDSFNDTHRTK